MKILNKATNNNQADYTKALNDIEAINYESLNDLVKEFDAELTEVAKGDVYQGKGYVSLTRLYSDVDNSLYYVKSTLKEDKSKSFTLQSIESKNAFRIGFMFNDDAQNILSLDTLINGFEVELRGDALADIEKYGLFTYVVSQGVNSFTFEDNNTEYVTLETETLDGEYIKVVIRENNSISSVEYINEPSVKGSGKLSSEDMVSLVDTL